MQYQNDVAADANLGPISYYYSPTESQSASFMWLHSNSLAFTSLVIVLTVSAVLTGIWRGVKIFRSDGQEEVDSGNSGHNDLERFN